MVNKVWSHCLCHESKHEVWIIFIHFKAMCNDDSICVCMLCSLLFFACLLAQTYLC